MVRRSRALGILAATAMAFPAQAVVSWAAPHGDAPVDDEPRVMAEDTWESPDSEASSASEDSDVVPDDPAATPLAGPWTFEEEAHGWTIDDGLVLPEVIPTPMQWARQVPGLQSDHSMAITPYGDGVLTVLRSPELPGASGPVVLEWWERWELEPDPTADFLVITWEGVDGSSGLVSEHPGPYSSSWPDWHRRRATIDTGGVDFVVAFEVSSDIACSGVTPCPHRPDDQYLGAWIDDVVVWAPDAVGELGQDGTLPNRRPDVGRVWEEPRDEYIGLEKSEFVLGSQQLEARYPGLVEFTTVGAELGDEYAVSVGDDGLPAWDPADTTDGRDFHALILTDESVPLDRKEHLVLTVAHSGEFCGYEGSVRWLEDLAIAFTQAPGTMVRAGTRAGEPVEVSVGQLLRNVRVVLVEIAPDRWLAGQQNGAGFNTNRIAFQDGWVVREDDVINGYGYSTLTQPAGAAVTDWLLSIRHDVQGGRPIAAALDMHGPLPVGNVLAQPQGADVGEPARTTELAARMTERTLEVLLGHETGPIRAAYLTAMGEAAEAQHEVVDHVHHHGDEAEFNKIAYLPAGWNSHSTPWEGIDYDIPSGWAAFHASASGLGADSFTHELPCRAYIAERAAPAEMQLYVDNMRAILDVMAVHAWERGRSTVERFDPAGPVGFVPQPERLRSTDLPSIASVGYPGTPFHTDLAQQPYDVANTDWFVGATSLAEQPVRPVPDGDLNGLATIVVADHTSVDLVALRRFAEQGGNVVLTDGALDLAGGLLDADLGAREDRAYVGYADIDDSHPWAEDHLPLWAQTYNPMPLGYPLLLERDQYWIACEPACADGTGPETYTTNSAPVWSVDRAAWEAAGGTTIGTVDPPPTPKSTHDGVDDERTVLGTVPVGEGRVVIFGAVLPQPSQDDFHPFGLRPYALTPMGHDLLLDAITWDHIVE